MGTNVDSGFKPIGIGTCSTELTVMIFDVEKITEKKKMENVRQNEIKEFNEAKKKKNREPARGQNAGKRFQIGRNVPGKKEKKKTYKTKGPQG